MLPVFRVFNFGGGVQSTALMHLILDGWLEKPDLAVFADTGWETPTTMSHVSACAQVMRSAGIRFEIVRLANIRQDHVNRASGMPSNSGYQVLDQDARALNAMPLFTLDPATGKKGMQRRQCTERYKIQPIHRLIRSLVGEQRLWAFETKDEEKERLSRPVDQWFGISTDEIERAKRSMKENWTFRYPLLDDIPMSRVDCERLNAERGTPAPKSACIGCPYRDRERWDEIRRDPEMWADAVAFDKAIRQMPGMDSQCFLHSARVPLDQVDFGGAPTREETDGMLGECDGLCGT